MTAFFTNHARGMIAEIYAALYLMAKGYRLRKWRYKTVVGEIDLIVSKKKICVFVEVKLRPSQEEGLYAITAKMRQRITRSAGHYLSNNTDGVDKESRFDVIVVSGFRIWHLDNAWFPNS